MMNLRITALPFARVLCRVTVWVGEEGESLQSNRRLTWGHANWVIMCCFTRAVSGW